MLVFVLLPYAACEIVPECGNLYISGVVAVCAVLVCFPTDFRASCRFGFVRGKVVPVCRNGFGFRCKTYGASKRLSSRRGAGGFDRYFFVPGVLRGLCSFIATRALFPMLVFVLLPTGGGEIVPECGNLYISGVVAVCTVLVCFPTEFRASCRFGFVRGKVMPVCRNGFGFCRSAVDASVGSEPFGGAGGGYGYFGIPGVNVFRVGSAAARTFFPMPALVLLPYVAAEIMPERSNLRISCVVATRTGVVSFPTYRCASRILRFVGNLVVPERAYFFISCVIAAFASHIGFPTVLSASRISSFVRNFYMTERIDNLNFSHKAHRAGKGGSSRRGAVRLDRYFAVVPSVFGGLLGSVATRTFLPMFFAVPLPYAACKVMSVCGYFYISGVIAVGTLFICFPTYCRTSCVFCIVLCNVVTFCGNGFGFCFKASGAGVSF